MDLTNEMLQGYVGSDAAIVAGIFPEGGQVTEAKLDEGEIFVCVQTDHGKRPTLEHFVASAKDCTIFEAKGWLVLIDHVQHLCCVVYPLGNQRER